MSADNGIYILRTIDNNGHGQYEYRVTHASAIENCNPKNPGGLKALAEYFGESQVFHLRSAVLLEAALMEDEIMASPFPVLEYGISSINLDIPFPKKG